MSTASMSYEDSAGRQRAWASWPLSKEFWGGVSLVTIWLAVLFVGVFGGNIQTTSADGSSSSWPVVTVVAIAALLGTISVGRWAFGRGKVDEDLRRSLEEQRLALEQLKAQLEDLRTRLPQS